MQLKFLKSKLRPSALLLTGLILFNITGCSDKVGSTSEEKEEGKMMKINNPASEANKFTFKVARRRPQPTPIPTATPVTQPTVAPTPFPPGATAQPTPNPTPAPTADPGITNVITVTDGYMDKLSYNQGETATAYINAGTTGPGLIRLFTQEGVQVASATGSFKTQQMQTNEPYKNGFGYSASFTFTIPATLKSGLYLWENKVPFIVKSAAKTADIVVVYPFNTLNAYNDEGGKSIYDYNSPGGRSNAVSFHRPLVPQVPSMIYCDYCSYYPFTSAFIKWIDGSNYNVSFIADMDLDDPAEIANAKMVIVIGHNEYWTRQARQNLDAFVDGGKDALILSGNAVYWQVRYSTDNSQMICYKDASLDPVTDPLQKTINWFEPTLQYSQYKTNGAELVGMAMATDSTGKEYDHGWNGYKIVTPNSPLLEGTNLLKGSIISLPTHENDGTKVLAQAGPDGYPVLDKAALGYYKSELIGYDLVFDQNLWIERKATFSLFQKTATSGVVINAGSTNWASTSGIGGTDGTKIQIITNNMIGKLLNKLPVFTY